MITGFGQREVFHLLFLRFLAVKLRADMYALKGGVNLRFFFGSLRYSEDMDLDVRTVEPFKLKDIAMEIISSKSLSSMLRSFNIEKVVPPDMARAKQTETTQRFKVHLINSAGEDLFTKIEFSRRKLESPVKIETVSDSILRAYKLHPLLIPHYTPEVAMMQKISALADRRETQARDIFDIFMLLPQVSEMKSIARKLSVETVRRAYENVFDIGFAVFRDSVVPYLADEDQKLYGKKEAWEDVQLKVGALIEGMKI